MRIMNQNKAYAAVSYQHSWFSLCGHSSQSSISVSSQGCDLGNSVCESCFWQKTPDVSWISLGINPELEKAWSLHGNKLFSFISSMVIHTFRLPQLSGACYNLRFNNQGWLGPRNPQSHLKIGFVRCTVPLAPWAAKQQQFGMPGACMCSHQGAMQGYMTSFWLGSCWVVCSWNALVCTSTIPAFPIISKSMFPFFFLFLKEWGTEPFLKRQPTAKFSRWLWHTCVQQFMWFASQVRQPGLQQNLPGTFLRLNPKAVFDFLKYQMWLSLPTKRQFSLWMSTV